MTRRCFTILETVLAMMLASVVVLGCMSAFLALGRTDQTLSARFHEAGDLARVQKAMQRAFSSLVLTPGDELDEDLLVELGIKEPTEPTPDDQTPDEQAPDEDPADEDPEAEVIPRPRILLEPDSDPLLTSMLQRSRYAAGGGGGSVAVPQRLELVLSSVPIRPPSAQSTAWANALVGVEDVEAELADGQEEYTGVRGAFVLRPDDPGDPQARVREGRGDERIGWTLWWQPLDGRSEPARVASGLSACHFQMFFNRQMFDAHSAFSAEAMPVYIQLEVETLTGLYANYLFETVWTVDALLEEEEALPTGGGGGGRGGGNGGSGGGAGDGAGDGGPGGGRRGGDPRARPRPNSPEAAPGGRPIQGQPRRRPPPGGPGSIRPGDGRPGGGGPVDGGGNRDGGGGGGG